MHRVEQVAGKTKLIKRIKLSCVFVHADGILIVSGAHPMRACFSVFDCLHIAILTHARTFLLAFWGCKTWCWCEQHGKHGSKAVWDRTLHLASARPRPLQTSSSTLTHRQMARTSGKRRSWQRLPRQFGTSLSSCQLNLRCWCLKTRPCLIGLAGSGQARKQPPPHTHTHARGVVSYSQHALKLIAALSPWMLSVAPVFTLLSGQSQCLSASTYETPLAFHGHHP